MGTTLLTELSVTQAKRRLQDTSRLSSEEVDELEKIVAAFHATRPRNKACVACGSAIWSEHSTADSNSSWACSACHRPASLTAEAWRALLDEKAQRAANEAAAIAATTPKPRDALRSAIERRSEAAGTLERLETALPAARAALAAASVRHDTAVVDMKNSEAAAIQRAAASLTGGLVEKTELPTDAARGRLRLAEDSLNAARGAKGLIDDQVHYAKRNLANAEAAVHAAALRVLAAETLEDLIEAAINARASYIDAVGGLDWLIRNHGVPNNDVRPSQLAREADSAPSTWPEAAHADGGMAKRLAAMMEDRP